MDLNIALLIFDFVVILPITLLRFTIINFYGSKYGVNVIDDFIQNGLETTKKDNEENKPQEEEIPAPAQDVEDIMNTVNSLLEDDLLRQNPVAESSEIDTECIYDLIKTVDKDTLDRKKEVANLDNNTADADNDTLNEMLLSLLEDKKNKKLNNSTDSSVKIPINSNNSNDSSFDIIFTDK